MPINKICVKKTLLFFTTLFSTCSFANENPVNADPFVISSSVNVMPNLYSDSVIENAPVTARIKTETVQILHDGNRIVQTEETMLVRDSSGRVRREASVNGDTSRSTISIFDPAKNQTIMLDPISKMAFKIPSFRDLIGMDFHAVPGLIPHPAPDQMSMNIIEGSEVVVFEGGLDKISEEFIELTPEEISELQTFHPISKGSGLGFGSKIVDATQLFSVPVNQNSLFSTARPVIKPLGQDTIGGVRVEGTRYTTTYPAQTFGNEKPIVVEKETWFAPELSMMLKSEIKDPRMGLVTYQADIINTDEPKASSFEIPKDYRFVDDGRGQKK